MSSNDIKLSQISNVVPHLITIRDRRASSGACGLDSVMLETCYGIARGQQADLMIRLRETDYNSFAQKD